MANVGDVTVNLRARVDQLERDLAQGQRAVEGFAGRAGTAFSRFGASIITLNQAVQLAASIGRTLGGALSGTVAAAGEARTAVAQLDQTLRSTGQFSRAYSDELRALAGRLQLLTAFGDEAILGVQRQLIAFGATKAQIEPLTKAVLDLSTGMGRDLSGAALLVGKALAGEFSTLSRFGIVINEKATDAQKLASALDQINQRFGGQAAAAAREYEGRLRLIGELFGDLQEEVGAAIVNSDAFNRALVRVADGLSDAIDGTRDWVEANRDLIDQRIDQVFAGIAAAAGAIPGALEAGIAGIQGLASTWNALPQELRDLLKVGGAAAVGARVAGTPGAIIAGGIAAANTESVQAFGNIPGVSGAVGGIRRAITAVQQAEAQRLATIAASRGEVGPPELVGPETPYTYVSNEFVGPQLPPAIGVPALGAAGAQRPSGPAGGGGQGAAIRETEQLIDLTEALSRIEASRAGFAEAAITRAETEVEIRTRALAVARDTTATQEELVALAQQLDIAERSLAEARIADLERKRQALNLTEGESAALTAQIEALNAELAKGPTHVEELTASFKKAATAADAIKSAFTQAFSDVITGTALGTGDIQDAISRLVGSVGQRLAAPLLDRAVGATVDRVMGLFGIGQAGVAAGTGAAAEFVGPPTEAQVAASGSNAPQGNIAGAAGGVGAAGAASGAIGAAGWVGIALMAIQGIMDATRAGNAARKVIGASEQDALRAAREALPYGQFLPPTERLPAPVQALLDPNMFILDALGLFEPPTGERQAATVIGELYKQLGLPGVPGSDVGALNLRPEFAGGLPRRPGFETGGALTPAGELVGLQLLRATPQLPEKELVAARTSNALLNTLSQAGVSLEDARSYIARVGRALNRDLSEAVMQFNLVRLEGWTSMKGVEMATALAINTFHELPAAIDTARLATLTFAEDGALSLKRLDRAIADAKTAIIGGITDSFTTLVEGGSAADAAEALGDQFGETFKARVAERLLQSETIGKALTEAAVLAERLAEARAAGDIEAAAALQADLQAVYSAAKDEYLAAITPIALATRQDLRIFSGTRAANGLIDEGNLTLPRFASGGVVGGPVGAAQLAIVHGGERVTTPMQQQQITGLLHEISGALRQGLAVTVNVAPAPVQIDGRDIVAATDRAYQLHRTGVTIPRAISHRG